MPILKVRSSIDTQNTEKSTHREDNYSLTAVKVHEDDVPPYNVSMQKICSPKSWDETEHYDMSLQFK